MHKKAQFIIPNTFIKEAKFGFIPRMMVRTRRLGRLITGAKPKAYGSRAVGQRVQYAPKAATPPPMPATPPPMPGATPVAPAAAKPVTTPVAPAKPVTTPSRYQPSRKIGGKLPANTEVTTPVGNRLRETQGTLQTKAPAGEEGFFSKFFKDDGQRAARISRIATPAGVGVGGYFLGRGQGYDKGMNEGELMAQQLAEIQAVRMQQQARDVYQNQGLIDRVMGRNPF